MVNQKLNKPIRLNSARKAITAILLISLLICVLQPVVFAANEPTRITVDENTTLEEAVTQANSMDSAIIEITTDVTVKGGITITSNIAIIGINGQHTISNGKFQVKDGGILTLGDGTNTNLLTILGNIVVTDGEINIQNGVKLTSTTYAIHLSGPNANGAINGGIIKGTIALYMENGAQLSEISGGAFYSAQETVYLTGNYTQIEKISNGAFYQTNPDLAYHGLTFCVDNNATIGEISGGYFEAVRNSALYIIRGGWVDKISGGEFVATRKGTVQDGDDPDFWNSVVRIEAERNLKTGIGTIFGGYFHGGARFGILLINYFGSTSGPRINLISGGYIQGAGVGLQPDVNTYVGEISGGTITGSQGILNAGTINKISGNVKISGTTSYAIYNYYTDSQSYGQINEISGGNIYSSGLQSIANAGTIKLISGGTITTTYTYAISNRGIINEISGGTIIGEQNALYCYEYGGRGGVLETITNGVFWGKTGTAIILSSPLQLETGLDTHRGLGRYQSGNGRIFNNENLVIYPAGYFMSSKTTPVEGIAGAEFRYLTLDDKYTIEYELNGGINNDNNPHTYNENDLPCLIVDPTKTGYDFQGWMIKNNADSFGPETNYSLAVGSTGDFTLTAIWSPDTVTYHVHYYLQNSKIPLATSKTLTGQINTPITETAITILGYTAIAPTTITTTLNATDNTITFYYTPNTNIQYTVHYYLENTAISLAPSKTITDQTLENTITESAITIPGYTAVAPTTITTTLNITDNTIIFYYTPSTNIQYTVYYYLQNTTTSLALSKTITGQTLGTTVTETAITIPGYTPLPPTTTTAILNATDNAIIFYYTPNIQYTVHYYLQNTTTSLALSKTITGQTLGTTVTETAITIPGYTAIAPTTITATLNVTDNAIIFYYTTSTSGGGGGGNSGGGSGSNSGGGNGGSQTKPTTTPPPPTTTTPPPTTPPPSSNNTAEPVQMWALVNLVLSIAGLILAIAIGICVLLQHKKKQKKTTQPNNNESQPNNKENQKQKSQHRNLWLAVALAMGIAGIIVFLLTEDMSRTMTLVDGWTIVNVIIFAVQIIAIAFVFKHQKNSNADNTEEPNSSAPTFDTQ
jgi:uncharacterized repeat protein (TIGR02543 family)